MWAPELDVGQAWGRFGRWGKVADGAVSSDGQSITAPLATVQTLALRRAP